MTGSGILGVLGSGMDYLLPSFFGSDWLTASQVHIIKLKDSKSSTYNQTYRQQVHVHIKSLSNL